MNSIFQSTKVVELGSCAFRQWKATHSHCSKLHGYQLKAKLWFGCTHLDQYQWAVNFGDFKELKRRLQYQFDHTTCVAKDDPELELFLELDKKKVIDLRVMDAVGTERVAQWVYEVTAEYIAERYGDRCWVDKVEVSEHDDNSAVYCLSPIDKSSRFGLVEVDTEQEVNEVVNEVATEIPKEEPIYNNSRGAPVGRKSTSGIRDMYEGTMWG